MYDNVSWFPPLKLRFPIGQVFQIEDQFNGPRRGTYWFRGTDGALRGSYHQEGYAALQMDKQANGQPFDAGNL